MIKRCTLILGAVLISAPALSENLPWFESNTALTQAHKHLLEKDLPSMFTSLIEVWQQDKSEVFGDHLNHLLIHSLDSNCGKDLSTNTLPQWLTNITVRQMNLQSPGRNMYRAVVDVGSTKEVSDILLTRWVSKVISTDDQLIPETQTTPTGTHTKYTKRYNLQSKLTKGLYRLSVVAKDKTEWSSWVILGEEKPKIDIRWIGKHNWSVDKHSLLNPSCPLPKLDVAIYDYVENNYTQVWKRSYDADYPTAIEEAYTVDPGRYVLAVSMHFQRWQGPLIVEDSQIISRTYDVSLEE